jgi:polyisoprenoid-binding protein YceI
MKKIFSASVTGLFILAAFVSMGASTGDNPLPAHKVSINLSDSKVQLAGTNTDAMHPGSAKFTGGELMVDDREIKGGSFTIDLNSFDSKDSRAHFEIKKITRLPVTRTEQGDIKFTHKIEGELTMKGQTKTISFDASVNMLKGKVAASSEAFNIDSNTSVKLDFVTD